MVSGCSSSSPLKVHWISQNGFKSIFDGILEIQEKTAIRPKLGISGRRQGLM